MERFMELYQTVYKDMYRLACYYMGNAQDAEDAVQDAALLAYENFGKLRDEGAFRPWIFRILINRCRHFLRKYRRMEPLPESPEAGDGQSLSSDLELKELLSRLTDEERLIITLSVFGGYKGKEIAQLLNKKHSTIRSKYCRALSKLRQEIEPGKEARG